MSHEALLHHNFLSDCWINFADDDEYDVYYDCDENGVICNTTYNEDEFDYYDYEETIREIKDYFKTHGELPPDAHFGDLPYYEPHTTPKRKHNSKKTSNVKYTTLLVINASRG